METEFLKNILKSISVSGYEEPLQNIVREEMQNVADEIREDEMHNLVCVANPDSPVRILLSAHADEIGLMISNITEDGRLQVVDRGGVVVPTYPGQQVIVKTKEREIPGVVEAYRGLFEKQGMSTKDLKIDIGAKDRKDALRYVKPGDPVVPDTHIRTLANGRITSRALDDRIGVYIIMEALKVLLADGVSVPGDVIAAVRGRDVRLVFMLPLRPERRRQRPGHTGAPHGSIQRLP